MELTRGTKNKKIKCINKNTGEEVIFSSLTEAAKFTGYDRRFIAKMLDNPLHFAHSADGYKHLSDGTISLYSKRYIWDVECEIGDPVVELCNCDNPEMPLQYLYSHSKAIDFLGCSKGTYYDRMKHTDAEGVADKNITDKYNNNWIIHFLKKDSDFKSNLKKLQ